jgi:hypothetical protein
MGSLLSDLTTLHSLRIGKVLTGRNHFAVLAGLSFIPNLFKP